MMASAIETTKKVVFMGEDKARLAADPWESGQVLRTGIKVLQGLRTLAEAQGTISLAEFRDRMAMPTASAHRVLVTLVEAGFARAPLDGSAGYEATLEASRLGGLVRTSGTHLTSAIRTHFAPALRRFQEPLTVAVHDRDHIVFVDKLASPSDPSFYCDVGKRLRLHQGAAARCVRAHVSDDEFEAYLSSPVNRDVVVSPAAAEAIRKEREAIVQAGFVLSVEEVDVGISAVAVPVLNDLREVIATVAIANVSARWGKQEIIDRASVLRTAATASGDALRYLPGA
jgi:DNA-binding IclR family transcriptional regulator